MRQPDTPQAKAQRILNRLRNLESAGAVTCLEIQRLRQEISAHFERYLEMSENYDRIQAQLEADEELKDDISWLAGGSIPELPALRISDCVMEADFFQAVVKSKGVAVKS